MAAVSVAANSRSASPGTSAHPCCSAPSCAHPRPLGSGAALWHFCRAMEMPQVTQDAQIHLLFPFNPLLSHLLTQFGLIF